VWANFFMSLHAGRNRRMNVTPGPGIPIPLPKKSATAASRLPAASDALISWTSDSGTGGRLLSTMNGGS
jgi:hypothetical protein